MTQTTRLRQGKFLTGLSSIVGDTRRQYEDRGKVTEVRTAGGLDLLVAIVADGVGSADNGGLAAQLSIDSVVSYMTNSDEADIALLITNAIKYANHIVYKDVITRNVDASTTLVVGVFYNDRLYLGNAGDSRAYWIQESGKVIQLTLDHSYANIKTTDPNAPNADVLVNAIGIRKEVYADIGLYVKDKDRKQAAKIGMQGLPLKLGDTILLCSDGLIKSDPNGNRFVRDEEIVHALQTETQPDAAALKMTGLAEGRYVDDNVTALTVQYTSPKRIENVLQRQSRKALRQKLIYAGLGIVAVAAITIGSLLFKDNIKTSNTIQTLTNLPSPTSGATPTSTPMIALPAGKLKFASMGSAVEGAYEPYPAGGPNHPRWSVSGLETWNQVTVGDEITLGSTTEVNAAQAIDIQTFMDVGLMLSLGAKGQVNSSVFIYDSSNVKLTYTDILEMELRQGTVFLRLESRSEIALVTLPNQQNAVVKLTGGSMLLHLNGDEIQLWCLRDDCSLEFGRESERTFAVQRRSYLPATGTIDPPMDIMPALYDELWGYNIKCNKCMDSQVLPEPTPTPTPTPIPDVTEETQDRPITQPSPEPTQPSPEPTQPSPEPPQPTPEPTQPSPTPIWPPTQPTPEPTQPSPEPTLPSPEPPRTSQPSATYTLTLSASPAGGGSVVADKPVPYLQDKITVNNTMNIAAHFTGSPSGNRSVRILLD